MYRWPRSINHNSNRTLKPQWIKRKAGKSVETLRDSIFYSARFPLFFFFFFIMVYIIHFNLVPLDSRWPYKVERDRYRGMIILFDCTSLDIHLEVLKKQEMPTYGLTGNNLTRISTRFFFLKNYHPTSLLVTRHQFSFLSFFD